MYILTWRRRCVAFRRDALPFLRGNTKTQDGIALSSRGWMPRVAPSKRSFNKSCRRTHVQERGSRRQSRHSIAYP